MTDIWVTSDLEDNLGLTHQFKKKKKSRYIYLSLDQKHIVYVYVIYCKYNIKIYKYK